MNVTQTGDSDVPGRLMPGDRLCEEVFTACALRVSLAEWARIRSDIADLAGHLESLAVRSERSSLIPTDPGECLALLAHLYRARAHQWGWLSSRRSVGVLSVWLFIRVADLPTPIAAIDIHGELRWRQVSAHATRVAAAARGWLLGDLLARGEHGVWSGPKSALVTP